MTIVIANIPSSGVTLDDQSARVDVFHASDTQIVTHQTVGVTDKWLEFRSDLIGNKALAAIGQDVTPWVFANAVMVISGYLWIDQDPTNTFGVPILSEFTSNDMYARMGYGSPPNTRVVATDWQKNLIAASVSEVTHLTYTGFAICYDWINYPTVHVRIYMNTGSGWVQEAHVDSGLSRGNFFFHSGGAAGIAIWGETSSVGRGAKWRGVHLCLGYSLTATDAPHITPWPIFMSGGCVAPKSSGTGNANPADDCTYDQWSGAGSTHGVGTILRWQDVGATNDMKSPGSHTNGGNDADGSLINSAIADQKNTFKNNVDAHPISTVTAPTIDNVRQAITHRVGGAGKVGCNPIVRLGGADSTINSWSAGTTYGGFESGDIPRPGGGVWTAADLAPGSGLEWGARAFSAAEASGATIGSRVTALPGPIPTYHVETLPTGDVGQAGQETPIGFTGGKHPLFRPQYDHITNWRQGAGGLRQIRRAGERIERATRNRCGRSGSVRVLR